MVVLVYSQALKEPPLKMDHKVQNKGWKIKYIIDKNLWKKKGQVAGLEPSGMC